MAEEMRMSVMAGSDAVDDERISIADNDDAGNDGDNQTRNTQQRHGYCTRRCKILCLVVVSVITAVVAAVLIPRYLNQKDTVTVMTNKSVNGSWGRWSSFSKCSRSCGNGTQARYRACDSPAASHGGFPCPGELEEAQNCNTGPCPVNGIWGQWTSFTECSRTCGYGTQIRKRACDSPAPSHGGIPCPGELEEAQICNTNTCPSRDCSELLSTGRHNSTYTIYPYGPSGESVAVYCEYNRDGVWTVIQRRIDGSVDFSRNWTEYKDGFGNVAGEYWLGNEALHEITSHGTYTLKIVLTDWNRVTKVAEYNTFRIGNENGGYRLTLRGYSGDAGDSMSYHNGAQFSTADGDNDGESYRNCAEVNGRGGWWYGWGSWGCGKSNLNGVYHHSPRNTDLTGIWWWLWHGGHYSLKATTMMVRKT